MVKDKNYYSQRAILERCYQRRLAAGVSPEALSMVMMKRQIARMKRNEELGWPEELYEDRYQITFFSRIPQKTPHTDS